MKINMKIIKKFRGAQLPSDLIAIALVAVVFIVFVSLYFTPIRSIVFKNKVGQSETEFRIEREVQSDFARKP